MVRFTWWASLVLCALSMALTPRWVSAEDKVIVITGEGTGAQYIEKGQAKQLNVVVKVGDTVTWTNNGDRTHTATSGVNTGGKPLFATGDIAKGTSSSKLQITQALYDTAVMATGGKAGERVHVGYFCSRHPTLMGGILVLEPQGFKEREKDKDGHK